jgi:hypothetical protein
MTILEKNFEDYLKSVHAEDYHGTDDNMPDAFEAWLDQLGTYELIEYADAYAQTIRDANKSV